MRSRGVAHRPEQKLQCNQWRKRRRDYNAWCGCRHQQFVRWNSHFRGGAPCFGVSVACQCRRWNGHCLRCKWRCQNRRIHCHSWCNQRSHCALWKRKRCHFGEFRTPDFRETKRHPVRISRLPTRGYQHFGRQQCLLCAWREAWHPRLVLWYGFLVRQCRGDDCRQRLRYLQWLHDGHRRRIDEAGHCRKPFRETLPERLRPCRRTSQQ